MNATNDEIAEVLAKIANEVHSFVSANPSVNSKRMMLSVGLTINEFIANRSENFGGLYNSKLKFVYQ